MNYDYITIDDEVDFTGIAPTLKHVKHLEILVNMIRDIPMEEIDGRGICDRKLMLCSANDFDKLFSYVQKEVLNIE